jgi:hypothetical protein
MNQTWEEDVIYKQVCRTGGSRGGGTNVISSSLTWQSTTALKDLYYTKTAKFSYTQFYRR